MNHKGKLYLIPTPISNGAIALTEDALTIVSALRYFIAEDPRTARRFLSSLNVYPSIHELNISVLNKHTPEEAISSLFGPVKRGHSIGLLSEAGAPAVADPGALAVSYAHYQEIQVIPLTGPSSIIMALMASGLNGQQFAFHGYLPVKEKEAVKRLKELERESKSRKQTQLFIETPYRNNTLLERLIRHLSPSTRLCVAVDITGQQESIRTMPVRQWRQHKTPLPKLPCLFLFQA